MTDKGLLELAAKAAGYVIFESKTRLSKEPYLAIRYNNAGDTCRWNPLTDDGDDARMEASLQFHITWMPGIGIVRVGSAEVWAEEPYDNDRQAARRRAGVRAAAEIGKETK